jgi:heme/copper-type cytochrome/quinol oxidase subunit 3
LFIEFIKSDVAISAVLAASTWYVQYRGISNMMASGLRPAANVPPVLAILFEMALNAVNTFVLLTTIEAMDCKMADTLVI